MKLINLFTDFRPLNKCGSGISAALGAAGIAGSLASTAYTNRTSSENVDKQLGFQQDENAINRDYNTREAEAARNWSAQMLANQQQYATTERIAAANQSHMHAVQMAGINAMYNSPVYQSQQLKEAGINPGVYFGNHASFGGSSQSSGNSSSSVPSSPSSSTASFASGLSPVSFQPQMLQVPQLMSAFADVATAGSKAGVDKATIKELISRAAKQDEESKLTRFLQEEKEIGNAILNATKDERIKQAFLDTELLRHNVLNAKDENEMIKANVALAASQTKLNNMLKDLKSEERFSLQFYNQRLEQSFKMQLDETRSRIRLNYASADEKKEQVVNMQQLRKLSLKEVNAKIKNFAADTNLKDAERRNYNAIAKANEVTANIQMEHAEEVFWKDFILDIVSQATNVVNTGVNVKNAISRAKSTDAWVSLTDAQKNKMQHEMDHYSDVVESVVETKHKGNKTQTWTRSHKRQPVRP